MPKNPFKLVRKNSYVYLQRRQVRQVGEGVIRKERDLIVAQIPVKKKFKK